MPMPANAWSPDDALWLSRVWEGWATPIMRKGVQRPLQESDLYGNIADLESEQLHSRAASAWEAELKRAERVKSTNPDSPDAKASIVAVIDAMGGKLIRQGSALLVLHGLLNAVVRPLLLRNSIRAMDPDVPLATAMAYAAALSVTLLIESWSKVKGLHISGDIGVLQIVSSAMHLVSAKTTKLRVGVASEGYEQTLLGKDLVGSAEFAKYMPLTVVCAVELVGGLAMLCWLAGAGPAFAGIGVMFVVLVLSMVVGSKMRKVMHILVVPAGRAPHGHGHVAWPQSLHVHLRRELYMHPRHLHVTSDGSPMRCRAMVVLADKYTDARSRAEDGRRDERDH